VNNLRSEILTEAVTSVEQESGIQDDNVTDTPRELPNPAETGTRLIV